MSTTADLDHTPAAVFAAFTEAIAHAALVERLAALRRDPDWRVIVLAGARRCDLDLTHWPTGARRRIHLETAGDDAALPWRRVT